MRLRDLVLDREGDNSCSSLFSLSENKELVKFFFLEAFVTEEGPLL